MSNRWKNSIEHMRLGCERGESQLREIGLLQVGLIWFKAIGASKLSWAKTFIPLYIYLCIVIIVFLVYFFCNLKTNFELNEIRKSCKNKNSRDNDESFLDF